MRYNDYEYSIETQDDYYDPRYPQVGNPKVRTIQRKFTKYIDYDDDQYGYKDFEYTNRIIDESYLREQQPYIPQNIQYDDYAELVARIIRNLPQFTNHHEEIAFCKYICECSIIDKRLQCLQEYLQDDPKFNIKLLFNFFDVQKSNFIDFIEFQQGLQKLDILLKTSETQQLFTRFGVNQQLTCTEFKSLLCGQVDRDVFQQFGAMKYVHHSIKQKTEQFLTVNQRNLIQDILLLQVELENNLMFIREVIGYDQVLLALFKQIDYEGKGYIVLQNLVSYINELGGDFFASDLTANFRRISKQKCSRINFTEFHKEFSIQDGNLHRRSQKRDYLQEIKQNKQPVIIEPAPQIQPIKQISQKLPQPYVQIPNQPQQIKIDKPQAVNDELNDVLFPGYQPYSLQQPIID